MPAIVDACSRDREEDGLSVGAWIVRHRALCVQYPRLLRNFSARLSPPILVGSLALLHHARTWNSGEQMVAYTSWKDLADQHSIVLSMADTLVLQALTIRNTMDYGVSNI